MEAGFSRMNDLTVIQASQVLQSETGLSTGISGVCSCQRG